MTAGLLEAKPANWAQVEAAQAGDRAAFGMLYSAYHETVFKFVHHRVGNRHTAEDLTSITFLRALLRIDGVQWQGHDLGAWLVTIARNLVADHFKSGRYRLEITIDSGISDRDGLRSSIYERPDHSREGNVETAVEDYVTSVEVLAAVRELNSEQQECVVLRFLRGLTVAETAEVMGKNVGAIKALQFRAVRTLGRLLKGQDL